jgi:hypothetical protein
MLKLPNVRVIVGTECEDTIPRRYIADMDQQLDILRAEVRRQIHTDPMIFFCSDHQEVMGFMTLHKLRECELTLIRSINNERQTFDLDIDGLTILPWPDEFFECCFYMLFLPRYGEETLHERLGKSKPK